MYQNRATLIGFLGKDAEVKTTKSNASFTMLSLATKRSWKNRESGEYQSQTTWHRCIVWGKLGEYAATLTKGATCRSKVRSAPASTRRSCLARRRPR